MSNRKKDSSNFLTPRNWCKIRKTKRACPNVNVKRYGGYGDEKDECGCIKGHAGHKDGKKEECECLKNDTGYKYGEKDECECVKKDTGYGYGKRDAGYDYEKMEDWECVKRILDMDMERRMNVNAERRTHGVDAESKNDA